MVFQASNHFISYHLLLGLSILFSFCSLVALINKNFFILHILYISYFIARPTNNAPAATAQVSRCLVSRASFLVIELICSVNIAKDWLCLFKTSLAWLNELSAVVNDCFVVVNCSLACVNWVCKAVELLPSLSNLFCSCVNVFSCSLIVVFNWLYCSNDIRTVFTGAAVVVSAQKPAKGKHKNKDNAKYNKGLFIFGNLINLLFQLRKIQGNHLL